VRRKSCGSVRITFLDRDRAVEEVRQAAQALVRRDRNVLAVGLFGSLARGEALPSSDADVLVVLAQHPQSRWFDRIPEYAAHFEATSLPVEVFPFTREELVRLCQQPGFVRTAVRELVHLSGDEAVWSSCGGTPQG